MTPLTPCASSVTAGAAALAALLALPGGASGHGAEHNPTRYEFIAENGIPSQYAGLVNPLRATPEALEAGQALYTESCALCHGERGDGQGEAAADLQPPPAALAGMFDRSMVGMVGMGGGPGAHLMHGVEHHHPGLTHAEAMGGLNLDAYMFWAVSEGGAQLGSSMPAFEDILSEEERWQILLYVANDFSTELN
jgi:mono/diheme cytochrome c family protein